MPMMLISSGYLFEDVFIKISFINSPFAISHTGVIFEFSLISLHDENRGLTDLIIIYLK